MPPSEGPGDEPMTTFENLTQDQVAALSQRADRAGDLELFNDCADAALGEFAAVCAVVEAIQAEERSEMVCLKCGTDNTPQWCGECGRRHEAI